LILADIYGNLVLINRGDILDIKVGQVVYSAAGRDKGKKFVVIEIIDSVFVLIADGSLRRIEKPKKKKTKHLETTDIIVENIKQKLENKLKVSNSEMRKILETVQEKEK